MLFLDILKVNICGTREFNYNAQKTFFMIEHGGVHWLPNNPIHGCVGFSKESIYSLVLVTSQHHIESDNMKVKPPLFDPVSHRDHDYDLQAKPSH